MTRNTLAKVFVKAALACITTLACAQSPESLDLTAVGKDPRWKVAGRTTTSVVDQKGKHALKVGEGPGNGVVWLDNRRSRDLLVAAGEQEDFRPIFVRAPAVLSDPQTRVFGSEVIHKHPFLDRVPLVTVASYPSANFRRKSSWSIISSIAVNTVL